MIAEMLADKKTSSNMTDSSLPKKKKKVTLRASAQGIVTAENALTRLGFESKINFAESQLISRSTVTKFFKGEPIQLDSLKRICTALKLNWQLIVGMSVVDEQQDSTGIELKILSETEKAVKVPTLHRQVKVVDPNGEKVKVVIVLEDDIDSVDNWEIILLLLRQNSGGSIEITDIESGSIRLTVEGSQADIQKLVNKIRSGKLTELNGLPIDGIEILTEHLDTEQGNKWDLVKEIIDRRITGRKLSDADLSDADLSGADLSGAVLSGAILSDANLSGAVLSDANLSGAVLSDANLSDANLIRAVLYGAVLRDANLRDANLRCAVLNGAFLLGANLRGADLRGAVLRVANLSGALLSDTDLRVANLSGALLSDTDLIRANLIRANLRGANLIRANLRRANLRGADLSGADLSGADLIRADVEKTRFGSNGGISESMKLDLQQRGAIFEDYPGDRSETYALR
jgi:uncharacterized protein YjbI with pentapeptide repeats/DNA-binding Xre family transcriptional regulator